MWFLSQAPIPTRCSNLILVTCAFSCSDQNFLSHSWMFSFLFFQGLCLNSRDTFIMLRLGHGWGESYHLGIVHSFFQHLLRYALPADPASVFSTWGCQFPWGLWFYRPTQHLLLHLIFLSTKPGQVYWFTLTASLKTKGGYLRLLSLDIPHSHLFTNALLPWREGNSDKIDDPPPLPQDSK